MPDDEIEILRRYAGRSAEMGNRNVSNLLNRFSIQDYRRMADEILSVAASGRLLDWGCGYGHMSYLLRRRGFDVVSLTVPDDNNLSESWNLMVREQSLDVTVAADAVELPFEDASFDGVLSCGVLEHVPDELGSLREIARVLRTGGCFLVYQLPNWLSVVELLSARLTGSAHERRYKRREVGALLSDAGFRIWQVRHGSMIPKNLDRLPLLRPLFDRAYRPLSAVDAALLRIPGLNAVSGTWEIVAQKDRQQDSQAREHSSRRPGLVATGEERYGARRD